MKAGEALAGMGTPDLRGTQGTFTFYTDDPEVTEGPFRAAGSFGRSDRGSRGAARRRSAQFAAQGSSHMRR